MILPQFCGVGVKPLFYCSTIPAQNEPETYSHSSNASVADCSDFDVVEKRLLCPGNILEFAMMNELGLYCVEEGFCHCIVPAVPLPTHTLHEPVFFQYCPEILAGILKPRLL